MPLQPYLFIKNIWNIGAIVEQNTIACEWTTGLPKENIDGYNLQDLVLNGWIYMETRKVLYRLKQSGALAAKNLAKDVAL